MTPADRPALGTLLAAMRCGAVLQLRRSLGDGRLAQVLQGAEVGWFSPRSWTYWHRKLGITPSGPVPPLPQRCFCGE